MTHPSEKNTTSVFDEARHEQVVALSQQVFGRMPERVAFPGGRNRSAFVADMGEAIYVFARRKNKVDSALEAKVLRCLGKTGKAPKLKARFDEWVVQEFLSGSRLPEVLDQMTSMKARGEVVSQALDSLLHLQAAAMSAGLHTRVPVIGASKNWAWDRTGAAKRISKKIGIAAPKLDRDWLAGKMEVKHSNFIKWDARPGNAMVDGEDVCWFDWEACGRGCTLNDLAFVLCDEWSCLDGKTEAKIEKHFLPLFNKFESLEEGHEYLRIFGTIHTVIRLRMALKFRIRDGKWWDRDMCLAGDRVGVTSTETARLVARGKRLADDVAQLRPYSNWLDEVAQHFELPACDDSRDEKHEA